MATDDRIIVFGEDVPMLRRNLLVRFGQERVMGTPISESAFLGMAVSAAMDGLRPVVELYMVDFLAVGMDAILNHAAKVESFSGGRWNVPMVLRAPCGGGYGDGGQHGQALWGWLAHIPGIDVVVPSTPADAGGLMLAALESERPVVFLEHKLLSESWLEFLGSGGRQTVSFEVPIDGTSGKVPRHWEPLPLGRAVVRLKGRDVTIAGVGVAVHRALEAARALETDCSCEVIDLRCVSPLDRGAVLDSVRTTQRLLVVDEDYTNFGLAAELAACVLEEGLTPAFARVGVDHTLPFARHLEKKALPNVERITAAARRLIERA
jgi:pyruvate dehydrogenase E1 component beta subunit